jgi:hypothetical protein
MEEEIMSLPKRLARLAPAGAERGRDEQTRTVPSALATAHLCRLLHTKLVVHLAALCRAQDAVAAEVTPRPRAHSMLAAFAAALAHSAATPRAAAAPAPFWPHAHGSLRLRDSDRVAVRNEIERLETFVSRSLASNGLRNAADPAAAASAAGACACALWLHDRLRDGLAWRALASEHPAVAAAAPGGRDRGAQLLRRSSATRVLPLAAHGPPLQEVSRWMREAYARTVTPCADALVSEAAQLPGAPWAVRMPAHFEPPRDMPRNHRNLLTQL